MPISQSNKKLLEKNSRELIAKLKCDFQSALGAEAKFLDDENIINPWLDAILLMAEFSFRNFKESDTLSMDNFKVFSEWTVRFLKAQMMLTLIELTTDIEVSLPDIPLSDVKKYLTLHFEKIFIDINDVIQKPQLKSKITNSQLLSFIKDIRKNAIGIYWSFHLHGTPKHVLQHLKMHNIEESGYHIWLDTKRLGLKIGFPKDFSLGVSLVKEGKNIGVAPFDPNSRIHRFMGFTWVQEILTAFLRNEVHPNDKELRPDLLKIIRGYQSSMQAGEFKRDVQEILDSKTIIEKWLRNEEMYRSADIDLHERYLQSETVVISSGWTGHAVGLAVIDNKLIYCNRGQLAGFENGKFGVFIYDLPQALTMEDIKRLNSDDQSATQFVKVISSFGFNPETPQFFIPAKPQNRGNCSFANTKTLVEGLLFVMAYQRQLVTNSEKARYDASLAYANSTYKKITANMRDVELTRVGQIIAQAENDPARKEYYLALLALLLLAHHNSLKEKNRAGQILHFLTDKDKIELVGNIYRYASTYKISKESLTFFNSLLNKFYDGEKPALTLFAQKNHVAPPDEKLPALDNSIKQTLIEKLNEFCNRVKKGKGVNSATSLIEYLIFSSDSADDVNKMLLKTARLLELTSKNQDSSSNYQLSQLLVTLATDLLGYTAPQQKITVANSKLL